MKKLKKLLEVITSKQDENIIKVNGMLKIVFEQRSTLDALITFDKFVLEFEKELKKRNINALEESADCEGYFNNKLNQLKSLQNG